MNTIKIIRLLGAAGLIALSSLAESGSQAPKIQSFHWTNRLELSPEQQDLLRVQKQLDNSDVAPGKRRQLEKEAGQLSAKLGADQVRLARPGELVIAGEKTGVASIFNPLDENLAFTVSVKGDEQWLGTREASMGRLTYLPPKGTLRVPNLYWTTPNMTHKD